MDGRNVQKINIDLAFGPHKPLVVGSNPSAATFLFTHPHAVEKVTSNSTLESILKQVEQRPQVERDTLASVI